MKSIQQKILASFLGLTAAAALICGGMGIAVNYFNTYSTLERDLAVTAGLAADRVAYELEAYRSAAIALGMVPELSDPEVSVWEKEAIVEQWASSFGMERGNLLDTSGDSLFDGNNYADRDYFQGAMRGETAISSPTESRITGELSIMVAAPVWEGGVYGGSHYSAAKAGSLGFSKAFAREVADYGVTVNCVCAGATATDIRKGISDEKEAAIADGVPMHRVGTAKEGADTICFLASDLASYITGEDIDINGGSHMD